MPLPAGDVGNLDEEPLARNILEAGLDDTELHSTTGVNQNLGQTSSAPRSDFSVHPLSEVNDSGPDGEPPAHVSQAVFRTVEGERGDVVGIR